MTGGGGGGEGGGGGGEGSVTMFTRMGPPCPSAPGEGADM